MANALCSIHWVNLCSVSLETVRIRRPVLCVLHIAYIEYLYLLLSHKQQNWQDHYCQNFVKYVLSELCSVFTKAVRKARPELPVHCIAFIK